MHSCMHAPPGVRVHDASRARAGRGAAVGIGGGCRAAPTAGQREVRALHSVSFCGSALRRAAGTSAVPAHACTSHACMQCVSQRAPTTPERACTGSLRTVVDQDTSVLVALWDEQRRPGAPDAPAGCSTSTKRGATPCTCTPGSIAGLRCARWRRARTENAAGVSARLRGTRAGFMQPAKWAHGAAAAHAQCMHAAMAGR